MSLMVRGRPGHGLAQFGDEGGMMVYCISCHAVGFVEAPGADPVQDREAWSPMACLFTPGCRGHVHPEAMN